MRIEQFTGKNYIELSICIEQCTSIVAFNVTFNCRIQCCTHSTLHSIVAFNVALIQHCIQLSHSTSHSIVAFKCCTHLTLHSIIAFNVTRIQHCIHSQANNHKITVTQIISSCLVQQPK